MRPYLIVAATLSAYSMLFAQVSLAEESPNFVAHTEQMQKKGTESEQSRELAKQAVETESKDS